MTFSFNYKYGTLGFMYSANVLRVSSSILVSTQVINTVIRRV